MSKLSEPHLFLCGHKAGAALCFRAELQFNSTRISNHILSKWQCPAAAETWQVFPKNKNTPKVTFCKRRLTRVSNRKGVTGTSPFSPGSPSHPGAALTALTESDFIFYFSLLLNAVPGQAEVCRDWNLPIWQQPTEPSSWLGSAARAAGN